MFVLVGLNTRNGLHELLKGLPNHFRAPIAIGASVFIWIALFG